jgi:hypothetical protein
MAGPPHPAAIARIDDPSVWNSMRSSIGPFLSLTAGDVGPGRSRAVLGYVESVMLFYDDPRKLQRSLHATAATAFLEILESRPEDGDVPLSKHDARLLREAPPLPDADTDLARRFVIGCGIGRMIIHLLADPGLTIRDRITEIEKKFNKARPSLGIICFRPMQGVEKNWWPRFRPVAHLWAASVLLMEASKRSAPPFPCSLASFPEFLAQAELIRYLAQRRKLARQGEQTLLEAGALAVSPEIPLPYPPFAIINAPAVSDGSTAE